MAFRVFHRDSVILQLLKRKVAFARLVEFAAGLAILFPLAGLLGEVWWGLDLLAHFRLQYLSILVIAGLYFLAVRKWDRGLICAVAAGILAFSLSPYFRSPAATPASAHSLKIVSFNVFKDNPQRSAVRDFLLKEDADLVLVLEVNDSWLADLALAEHYPFQGLAPARQLRVGRFQQNSA